MGAEHPRRRVELTAERVDQDLVLVKLEDDIAARESGDVRQLCVYVTPRRASWYGVQDARVREVRERTATYGNHHICLRCRLSRPPRASPPCAWSTASLMPLGRTTPCGSERLRASTTRIVRTPVRGTGGPEASAASGSGLGAAGEGACEEGAGVAWAELRPVAASLISARARRWRVSDGSSCRECSAGFLRPREPQLCPPVSAAATARAVNEPPPRRTRPTPRRRASPSLDSRTVGGRASPPPTDYHSRRSVPTGTAELNARPAATPRLMTNSAFGSSPHPSPWTAESERGARTLAKLPAGHAGRCLRRVVGDGSSGGEMAGRRGE